MARRKRTAFVPRLVFRVAIAGVVPACVAACSSGGLDGDRDMAVLGVAADLARPDLSSQWFFDVAVDLAAVPDLAGSDAPDLSSQWFFDVAFPFDLAVPPDLLAVADAGFGDGGSDGSNKG
jgi:hypothetical protein